MEHSELLPPLQFPAAHFGITAVSVLAGIFGSRTKPSGNLSCRYLDFPDFLLPEQLFKWNTLCWTTWCFLIKLLLVIQFQVPNFNHDNTPVYPSSSICSWYVIWCWNSKCWGFLQAWNKYLLWLSILTHLHHLEFVRFMKHLLSY